MSVNIFQRGKEGEKRPVNWAIQIDNITMRAAPLSLVDAIFDRLVIGSLGFCVEPNTRASLGMTL